MTNEHARQFTSQDLEHRFDHHPPITEDRKLAHESVRSACLDLAEQLDNLVPDGREKALAITNLEQTMFWANAALARSG